MAIGIGEEGAVVGNREPDEFAVEKRDFFGEG